MTNTTRLLLALTAVNMVMVSVTALMTTQTARAQETNAQQVQPTIRTRGLQIVDDEGRVRATHRGVASEHVGAGSHYPSPPSE